MAGMKKPNDHKEPTKVKRLKKKKLTLFTKDKCLVLYFRDYETKEMESKEI